MAKVLLDDLNKMDKTAFVATLGDIFEHAPWIADAVLSQRPFSTLVSLHDAMARVVQDAGSDRQVALIRGHPDLAGKVARSGSMTAHSKAEQGSAGLDQLSVEEFETFHRHNDAYRSKFAMPFIICVRRHTKDSILRQFESRQMNDAVTEHKSALAEILRIAALRLDLRVSATDCLKVHGRLSTHVLNTHGGRPAEGVVVELFEIANSGASTLIAHAITNSDGRTEKALIGQRPIPIGCYEIRFAIGEYFSRVRAPQSDPPFLEIVPVRFSVAEPEGHYHVPLLATPWSYSSYRGS
jgi:2-oxo-4-hydroxy-4-carboxy-5-ureidoimidazoline decarboxylase